MAILLVTQDRDVEERCRRATSARYSIAVVDSISLVPAQLLGTQYEVVLIDADTLTRPYAEKVSGIVATPGVGRVIVMTQDFLEDEEVALLRSGVQGCCRRGIDAESLAQILSVTESSVWVTRSLLPRLVSELRRYAQQAAVAPAAGVPASEPAPAIEKPVAERSRIHSEKLAALTRRERDIVNLLAEGATNKQVAEELDISERTVKGHLSNVFMKLGVSGRLNLVLLLNGGSTPQRLHDK
jgi:two-component system, NarL family, nitrate/nitrite response regulator NarL